MSKQPVPNRGNLLGNPIFVDEPEPDRIVLGFNRYVDTISGIILRSKPRFTVGIFGEWGTGKTTLLNAINKKLKGFSCTCLEFNAWRYEKEKTHATIPLMLIIIEHLLANQKICDHLNKTEPDSTIVRIVKNAFRVLRGLTLHADIGVSQIAQIGFSYDFSQLKEDENKPTAEQLIEIYKQRRPLLQEGLDLIEELLKMIDGASVNNDLKLVIFIDDLDRCAPEKAAEVFESIKVFFDIPGIVFVLGLSKNIVEAAIDFKYHGMSNGLFTGNDYLKKIIQVPFTLPMWTSDDLAKFVDVLIDNYDGVEYKEFFKQNKVLISRSVESNPRDVKRLLNNFILADQIIANAADKTKLLVVQALSIRWKWFYDRIIENPERLQTIKKAWSPKTTPVNVAASSRSKSKRNTC